MRQETALILSVISGGAITAIASLIGDGRAQHGVMLAVVGYPFFILFGAIMILLARQSFIKLKIHTPIAYYIFGGVLAILLGSLVGFRGGIHSGVVLGAGVFVSFAIFSFLSIRSADA